MFLLLLPRCIASSAPNRDLRCIVLFTMELVGRYRQPGQPLKTMHEPLPASEGCGAAFSQDLDNTIRHEVTYLRGKLDVQGVIKIRKEYNTAGGRTSKRPQFITPYATSPKVWVGKPSRFLLVFNLLLGWQILELIGNHAPNSPASLLINSYTTVLSQRLQ
jgi:hypothetical protein